MRRARSASPPLGVRLVALSGLLTAAPGNHALPAEPRYLPAREIVLEYQVAADVVVDDVEVWMRRGASATEPWERRPFTPLARNRVRVRVPEDGAYDFYLILHNAGGASASPPTAETAPLLRVVVDSTPPLIQVHEARVTPPDPQPSGPGPAEAEPAGPLRAAAPPAAAADRLAAVLLLRATIVEEHLAESALRLFYRFPEADWCDGGPVQRQGNTLRWPWPLGLGRPHEMRLLVVDRAGNRAWTDIVGIDRAPPGATGDAPAPPPPTAAAGVVTSADPAARVAAVQPVEPPAPVRIEPVAPVASVQWERVSPPATAPADPPRSDPAWARELRARAAQFAAEGRLDLAAARLEDAVSADPSDPAVRVELGRLLYRLGQIEAAGAQFDAARELRADDPGALDGLALVAATRGRYAEARDLLLHLRAVTPDHARLALRLGDVEHRLGRTDAAVRAWQQALAAPDADATIRAMARRRLEYFDPQRALTTAPSTESDGPRQEDPRRTAPDRRASRRG